MVTRQRCDNDQRYLGIVHCHAAERLANIEQQAQGDYRLAQGLQKTHLNRSGLSSYAHRCIAHQRA